MTGIDRIQQSKRYLLMQFEDAENEYFTLYDKETDDMRTTKSLYNSLLGRLPLQQEGEHFTIQHDHIVQCHDAYFFQLWNTNGHLESGDTRFYTEELRKRFVELASGYKFVFFKTMYSRQFLRHREALPSPVPKKQETRIACITL